MPPQGMAWLFCVVALLVGAAAGLFVGYTYRKKIAEKEIGSAEDEATRIINEAIKGAEAKNVKPLWKHVKRFTAPALSLTRKRKNAVLNSRSRNGVCSKKKSLLTESTKA